MITHLVALAVLLGEANCYQRDPSSGAIGWYGLPSVTFDVGPISVNSRDRVAIVHNDGGYTGIHVTACSGTRRCRFVLNSYGLHLGCSYGTSLSSP